MSNIIDYIKWRGDLSVNIDSFNEVDGLILSRASYFPFESLMKENEIVTFKEIGERYKKLDVNKFYDFSYEKYTLNRQADNILKWKDCVKNDAFTKNVLNISVPAHIHTKKINQIS